LAVLFAMAFPTILAWGHCVALVRPGTEVNRGVQWAYATGKVVQFGFPVLFLVLGGAAWPRSLRPQWKGLGTGFAFGLVVAGLMLAVYFGLLRGSSLFAVTPGKLHQKLEQMGLAAPARYAALAGFIVLAHSLLEEYYWRWFVFHRLRQLVPVVSAVGLASLAFMSHHVIVLAVYMPGKFWMAVVPLSLAIAVGGAFWAWLYDQSGTLYPSWLSHALIDAAILAIGWDLLLLAPAR
jgi:membrane protease YdiL (CAAX protease family)